VNHEAESQCPFERSWLCVAYTISKEHRADREEAKRRIAERFREYLTCPSSVLTTIGVFAQAGSSIATIGNGKAYARLKFNQSRRLRLRPTLSGHCRWSTSMGRACWTQIDGAVELESPWKIVVLSQPLQGPARNFGISQCACCPPPRKTQRRAWTEDHRELQFCFGTPACRDKSFTLYGFRTGFDFTTELPKSRLRSLVSGERI